MIVKIHNHIIDTENIYHISPPGINNSYAHISFVVYYKHGINGYTTFYFYYPQGVTDIKNCPELLEHAKNLHNRLSNCFGKILDLDIE